jgi:hypothetical protein
MKKLIIILALIAMFVSACSPSSPAAAPDASQASAVVVATATETALPPTATFTPVPPSDTPAPTLTFTPTVTFFPTVTFSKTVTCRLGPDPLYFQVMTFTAGKTSEAQSRSEDGKWLVVTTQAPNMPTICWVPVTSVADFGDVNNLLVSNPPSLPSGPSSATVSKSACGKFDAIVVTWSPATDGVGYRVYRNGTNIATIYGEQFIDHKVPGTKASKPAVTLTYTIQAFDSTGLSKSTASASVTLCD